MSNTIKRRSLRSVACYASAESRGFLAALYPPLQVQAVPRCAVNSLQVQAIPRYAVNSLRMQGIPRGARNYTSKSGNSAIIITKTALANITTNP